LRTQKKAEQRERKEAIYAQMPRLEAIEWEISLIGASLLKLVAQKPQKVDSILQELKEKQQKLIAEREALLAAKGLSLRDLQVEYTCSACEDTGYIGSKMCRCMKGRIMEKMYAQSNVRQIIEKENFDTFDLRLYSDAIVEDEGISPKENARRNLKMAMAFARDFSGDNLLLYGGTGRGKTFLCNCIAKDVLDAGKTVLYLTAGQMFRQLEAHHFRDREEDMVMDWDMELMDADLLIIDDLGTEFSTVFTASELFRIINDRKLRNRPVVISTNLDYADLMQQYSDRVMSRLIGEYTVMKCFGEDIRMKKKFSK
jgi:DNA replication protein DnaC